MYFYVLKKKMPRNALMASLLLACINVWADFLIVGDFRRQNTHVTSREWLRLPGPRLNIKTVLSTYGDFHVKDKTAVRTSYL